MIVALACLPGITGYAMLTFGALGAIGKGGDIEGVSTAASIAAIYVSLACGWFAWWALWALSRSWCQGSRRSPRLAAAGTIAAGIALAPLSEHLWLPMLLASPGIALATSLVLWHAATLRR